MTLPLTLPEPRRAKPGEVRAWVVETERVNTDECIWYPFLTGIQSSRPRIAITGPDGKTRNVLAVVHFAELHGNRRPPGTGAIMACGHDRCVNGRHVNWTTRFNGDGPRDPDNVRVPKGKPAETLIAVGPKLSAAEDRRSRSLTPAVVAEVRRYAAEGMAVPELALEFGVGEGRIKAALR